MNKPLEAILDYEEAMSIDSQLTPYACGVVSNLSALLAMTNLQTYDLENAMSLEEIIAYYYTFR